MTQAGICPDCGHALTAEVWNCVNIDAHRAAQGGMPFVVGVIETSTPIARFTSYEQATAFIGILAGAAEGRYYLDGPELAGGVQPDAPEPDFDPLRLAGGLCEEFANDIDMSDDVETIAASRWAVCVQRDDDGWVYGCDTADQVARIVLGTLVGTDGYDEWVSRIVDMTTGQDVEHDSATTVSITIAGETGTADTRIAPTEGEVAP
jgi:hypothetical protein